MSVSNSCKVLQEKDVHKITIFHNEFWQNRTKTLSSMQFVSKGKNHLSSLFNPPVKLLSFAQLSTMYLKSSRAEANGGWGRVSHPRPPQGDHLSENLASCSFRIFCDLND